MSVVVGGGSGFIGRHLVPVLRRRYNRVYVVTRGKPSSSDELTWDTVRSDGLPPDCEAIIGLQGLTLLRPFRRFDQTVQDELRRSRIETMKVLIKAAELTQGVHTIVSMSGVGYYPPSGSARYTESSSIEDMPTDFVRTLSIDCENAGISKSDNIRHVIFRSGIVLGPDGGLIKHLYPSYWLGLGATFSEGSHWFPWIHVDDLVGLISEVLSNTMARGPYNAVAPAEPITQKQFAKAFAASFSPPRPVLFAIPRCVLNQIFGPDLTATVVCNGQHVRSERISRDMPGFSFKYPTIDEMLVSISTRQITKFTMPTLTRFLSTVLNPGFSEERGVSMRTYLQLSKHRLSALSALSGYLLAPGAHTWMAGLWLTSGTFIMSCGANTYNQILECTLDAQMARTRNRALPAGKISYTGAMDFALVSSTSGFIILCSQCSTITPALLGLLNTVLYSGFYTAIKRRSPWNTVIGSIVGAIPPVMGWAASAGQVESGALILGTILYLWQFPHFNSLNWLHREDYARAGYKMMCTQSASLFRWSTAFHGVALIPLCLLGGPLLTNGHYLFSIDSLPLNLIFAHMSVRFALAPSGKNARSLFMFSIWHLPALLCLAIMGSYSHVC